MRRLTSITGAILVSMAMASGVLAATPRHHAGRDSSAFERGHRAYMGSRFEDALALFEQAAAAAPSDAATHAWLGFTWWRLGLPELGWREAHVALALDSCSTVGWQLLSRALDPHQKKWRGSDADSAWACLLAAARCDSLDGEIALDMWIGALEHGDEALARRTIRRMRESGLLRPPLFAHARWTLGELPPRAIIIVNGDADCYPMLIVQDAEGFRSDVTLVHLSLLSFPWYRRYVRDRLEIPMPFGPERLDALDFAPDGKGGWIPPNRELLAGWMTMLADSSLRRPLTMVISVEDSDVPERVELCGAYWRLDPGLAARPHGETVDTAAMRRGLFRVRADEVEGEPVSAAVRSPHWLDSGSTFRNNLAVTVIAHYQACRRAGAARQAEELRAWALPLLVRLHVSAAHLETVRALPDLWGSRTR